MSGNVGSSLLVEVEPDITAAELNVLIEDLAGTLGVREGGATIVLPSARDQLPGKYEFTESIKIRQHIVIEGEGPGTLLARKPNEPFTGDAILINAEEGDRRFAVRNLAIDASEVDYGIHFNTPVATVQEFADGIFTIENVEIFTPNLDGIWLEGRGQALVRGIRVRDAERHGYVIDSVDSVFDALEAGGSGAAGLVVRNSNNRFANCKFFYSGRLTPAQGYGIWITGGGKNAVFVNCETQDNNNHGVFIQNFDKVWIANHISEGNNAGHSTQLADQNGNAYHLDNASDVKIRGTAIGRTDNVNKQKHAIGLGTAQTENLKAELISEDNVAGHILNGWHFATDIRINNYDGNQDIFRSLTGNFTPNPTLGRKIYVEPFIFPPNIIVTNITINNPLATNYAVGQELEFIIKRLNYPLTVTWGSEFKFGDFTPVNAPNTANAYTFRRLSDAWVLVSAMAGIVL